MSTKGEKKFALIQIGDFGLRYDSIPITLNVIEATSEADAVVKHFDEWIEDEINVDDYSDWEELFEKQVDIGGEIRLTIIDLDDLVSGKVTQIEL